MWRTYFRSTRAHNTIEVDGEDQGGQAGPFMWSSHADAVVDQAEAGAHGVQTWAGHHTGYARLDPALRHDRHVALDGPEGRLSVTDTVTGSRVHSLRMFWHLGPDVDVQLEDAVAHLTWRGRDDIDHHGRLELPAALGWSDHTGETGPPLGWYSPRFGQKVPLTTLVGVGTWTGTLSLRTDLRFSSPGAPAAVRRAPDLVVTSAAVPRQDWGSS